MRTLVKRLFVGTPLESPLRRAHYALTRSKSSLYDHQTIQIMRCVLRHDSNAIDIGAFEGGMLSHIVRLAPGGRHMAFEPQPDRYERLVKDYPTVKVHGCALGRAPGRVTFYRMLKHPALSGLSRRLKDLPHEDASELQVPMESLDRVVPPDFPIAFVKIDAEGAELEIFRGGVQTLRRTRPVIVFECGLGGADYFDSTPGELFEFVADALGLKISLLGAWLSGKPPLSKAAFIEQFERRLNYYFVAHP